MATKLQELKWKLFCYKQKKLLLYGLKKGYVELYNDELIEKLRKVYYGGIPASIILLSDGLTNGHCYDRALLLSKAFLDDDGDVKLLYASIDSLKLNPKFICNDPLYADHCIVERTTKDGRKLIYDTSSGFIYDKDFYWKMENPVVRNENGKETIKQFVKKEDELYPEDIERDKYIAPLILSTIEMTYGKPTEMYSMDGIERLQREIEHYKELINYNEIIEELKQGVKVKKMGSE